MKKVTKSATIFNACLWLDRSAISSYQQPCDLRRITTEIVDVEYARGSLQTFQDILSFGNKNCKNLSGLGELVILENFNQTSFVMQVTLKTSLEAT